MLVLARRAGETLVIGKNIQVTVVRVGRRTVRLKIDAPRGILVDRDEVRRRRVAESEPVPPGQSPCLPS